MQDHRLNEGDFELSFLDRIHSQVNELRLRTRTRVAFSRNNYREEGVSLEAWNVWLSNWPSQTVALIHRLELQYKMTPWRSRLSLENYTKNLATLWLLEQMLETRLLALPTGANALEAGSQDFMRAPAISNFLQSQALSGNLTGVEIDAFPVLASLHSRYDIAQYLLRFLPRARYLAQDFFTLQESAELIFAFYPFVSPHPSLAWGLPHQYGSADRWVQALERNLVANGLALVVHQGAWEQEEFDNALLDASRRGAGITRICHQELNCPFYPLPYAALASLYRKD